MEVVFSSSDDLATEIFSRLPAEDITIRIQVKPALQDFLPEKVNVILASCNGLLCCQSIPNDDFKEPVRQRRRYENRVQLNSAKELSVPFCPFGTSVNKKPCFKLVGIQRSEAALNAYSFVVCSSETGKWTTSKEVWHCHYRIHKNREILVVGNRFYWLTWNHHIITSDAERELSGVIELPGPVMGGEGWRRMCLGSSEGYFHYLELYTALEPIILPSAVCLTAMGVLIKGDQNFRAKSSESREDVHCRRE
ncbi:unnamed protein product [Dovyalis caffra]|uniref:F-box protein At3g26010-like beta-propeller domain-containing protein n=1 Tax=Dovyalis caffra TaxID=77055 RepID=A0AAV1RK97_9ROSI|nr:unnamed protein product [Dovyalis caffra]